MNGPLHVINTRGLEFVNLSVHTHWNKSFTCIRVPQVEVFWIVRSMLPPSSVFWVMTPCSVMVRLPTFQRSMLPPSSVFRVVTPCNVVIWCQRFERPCCFHLRGYQQGSMVQKTSTWTSPPWKLQISQKCHSSDIWTKMKQKINILRST
jgi:hypothetical protein